MPKKKNLLFGHCCNKQNYKYKIYTPVTKVTQHNFPLWQCLALPISFLIWHTNSDTKL